MHLVHRSVRSVPWVDEGTPDTHKETRLNRPWCRPKNVKILLPVQGAKQHDFEGLLWGQKVLEALAHSISSPKPTLRRKKYLRSNEGNPDRENVLPRTTLSSTGQNHKRGKCHVARGNPLKDRKRDSKPYGLAIGVWWRSNPRRSCHFRINTHN